MIGTCTWFLAEKLKLWITYNDIDLNDKWSILLDFATMRFKVTDSVRHCSHVYMHFHRMQVPIKQCSFIPIWGSINLHFLLLMYVDNFFKRIDTICTWTTTDLFSNCGSLLINADIRYSSMIWESFKIYVLCKNNKMFKWVLSRCSRI